MFLNIYLSKNNNNKFQIFNIPFIMIKLNNSNAINNSEIILKYFYLLINILVFYFSILH
jgi:hypothetical protein